MTLSYQPVPDYILDSVEVILVDLLPLLRRAPGPVTAEEDFARYRKSLKNLADDTRAAARSETLADDIAAIVAGFASVSTDTRATIEALERVVTAARGIAFTEATCATLKVQRANEQALALLFETLAIAAQAETLGKIEFRSVGEAKKYRLRFGRSIALAIERASDAGQIDVARSLREVSGRIVRDIIERGRPLPRVVNYETAVPLPADTLAHLLYQDAGRREQLLDENETDHPAFMPRVGRAYSR